MLPDMMFRKTLYFGCQPTPGSELRPFEGKRHPSHDEALSPPDVGGLFSFSGVKVVILIPRISNHKPSEVQPIYFQQIKMFSKNEEFSNKKNQSI